MTLYQDNTEVAVNTIKPSVSILNTVIPYVSRQLSIIRGPAILFIILEILDGLMTLWATNNGFAEVNPLVAGYAHTWIYPVSKLCASLLALTVLLPFVNKHFKLIRTGFMATSIFVATIIATNFYEIGGRFW